MPATGFKYTCTHYLLTNERFDFVLLPSCSLNHLQSIFENFHFFAKYSFRMVIICLLWCAANQWAHRTYGRLDTLEADFFLKFTYVQVFQIFSSKNFE